MTASGWTESFADGGLVGCFDQHRPFDWRCNVWPLLISEQTFDTWRPRFDPERPVRRVSTSRSRRKVAIQQPGFRPKSGH